MKLVIDASNIKVGGGLQVALSVINYLLENNSRFQCISYVITPQVYKQIRRKDLLSKYIIVETSVFTLIPFSKTSKNITNFIAAADVVFTVFGPNFWGEHKNHLMGFANAWLVSPSTNAYKRLPVLLRLKAKIKNKVLAKILYKPNRYYITETIDIQRKFCDFFSCEPKMIKVIPNTLPYMYSDKPFLLKKIKFNEKIAEKFKFITIASNYPHKNLQVMETVGDILTEKGLDFIFMVTIPEQEYSKLSTKFRKYTHNLGVIPVSSCPDYYFSADAMFLPTILECFTVSYLEAFACGTPVVTSNLEFATEICKSAAIYFDPYQPEDIALKLEDMILNKNLSVELVKRGYEIIKYHPSNIDKINCYIEEIFKIGNKNNV